MGDSPVGHHFGGPADDWGPHVPLTWWILALVAVGCLGVLIPHLWTWLSESAVSSDGGTYKPFVIWPVVVGSAEALACVIAAGAVLRWVHPRGLSAAVVLTVAVALVSLAVAQGYSTSTARQHPEHALVKAVDRLRLGGGLVRGSTRFERVQSAPEVSQNWGGAGTVGCARLSAAARRAYPGGRFYGEEGDGCGVTVFWRGLVIDVWTDTGPKVAVLATVHT